MLFLIDYNRSILVANLSLVVNENFKIAISRLQRVQTKLFVYFKWSSRDY